jgi:hypothetical protein
MNDQNHLQPPKTKIIIIGSPVLKIVLIFLAIVGATTLLMQGASFEFGHENFWNNHGVFFLFFIAFFPRLTLLFSNVPFGGLLWFLGFFFAPRLLVATLATIAYWNQNPLLVLIAWVICLSGESSEKYMVHRKMRYPAGPAAPQDERRREQTIDAEFKKMN